MLRMSVFPFVQSSSTFPFLATVFTLHVSRAHTCTRSNFTVLSRRDLLFGSEFPRSGPGVLRFATLLADVVVCAPASCPMRTIYVPKWPWRREPIASEV